MSLRTTLRGRPGSHHRHLKVGDGPGTLEATFWPGRRRLWLTVQDGRRAPWVEPAAERLGEALVGAFADCASPGARV